MAHGGQAGPVQGPSCAVSQAAGGAVEDALPDVQPGVCRLGLAADGAGVQQGLIARHTEELKLKGSLHQGEGLFQFVQGVEGIEHQR